MACFSPLQGFRQLFTGKVVFSAHSAGTSLNKVTVACGNCVGCRLRRSAEWAIRCVHEAKMFDRNSFITLTYDSDHLPKFGSLVKKHFQDFMKRLRVEVDRYPELFLSDFSRGVRYYHCGEYGELRGRPHYHSILFNLDFSDKVFLKFSNGIPLFTSDVLRRIWGKGHVSIGDVTFESAAYVARYVLKKVNGKEAFDAYSLSDDQGNLLFDSQTGEFLTLLPEYTTMSRRNGIGKSWYDKYKSTVYPSDSVVHNHRELRPPRYYDGLFELDSPSDFESLKRQRVKDSRIFSANNTSARLLVRRTLAEKRIKQLVRPLV